jgi:hypothetical protein
VSQAFAKQLVWFLPLKKSAFTFPAGGRTR